MGPISANSSRGFYFLFLFFADKLKGFIITTIIHELEKITRILLLIIITKIPLLL